MNHHLSDDQVHQRAVILAAEQGVSYSEALGRAVVLCTHSSSAYSDPMVVGGGRQLDDDALNAATIRFAAQKGISYSEALHRVASVTNGPYAAYSESVRPTHVSPSDHSLHLSVIAFAGQHGITYTEALGRVAASRQSEGKCARNATASFSEAPPAGSAADLLSRQPIEVFRAGSQIDTTGNSITFGQSDIAAMAENYNPAKHEAPLTLGHPVDDKPAYGWVQSLHATPDGRLMMLAKQIDPAFAESVKQGRYKKRSASFYPPQNPNNPIPGTWYLKHIAWLGSAPPAVKGMADVGFSDGVPDGLVTFDLG